MKILTVRQPWAWAIVTGLKAIENRSWVTNYRGPLLIHAGKSRRWLGAPEVPEAPAAEDLVFGAILGGVNLVDCVPVERLAGRRFASGPYCWLFEGAWSFTAAIPCNGALGLWSAKSNLAAALEADPTYRKFAEQIST